MLSWHCFADGGTSQVWQPLPCRMLIEEHYPWFLETYDGMDEPIMRADAVRDPTPDLGHTLSIGLAGRFLPAQP